MTEIPEHLIARANRVMNRGVIPATPTYDVNVTYLDGDTEEFLNVYVQPKDKYLSVSGATETILPWTAIRSALVIPR